MRNPLLAIRGIQKSFGAIRALKGVNIEVAEGEVHALIGENGAGKSTLMKILSRAETPDAGTIVFRDQPYEPANPAESRALGVAMIYQELTLAPHLTVEENITLGMEQSRLGFVRNQRQKVREILSWLDQAEMAPETPVSRLSVGKQQLVEIARALSIDAKLVIMDEPTSSLTAADTQVLFRVIRKLKERGISIIYISHFLEEVKQISDRFTVLRDGETVGSGEMANVEVEQIIRLMIGRSLDEMYPPFEARMGEDLLRVSNLSGQGMPHNVSFTLRKGEVLGLYGLMGAGRSETVRSLFGLHKTTGGQFQIRHLPGLKVSYLTPNHALQAGINLLSEDRKEEGLAIGMSIGTNITLSSLGRFAKAGFVDLRREYQTAAEWCKNLGVKTPGPEPAVGTLSGGNQQKVAIARLLLHDSDVLFLDEPTRGIDVGSKVEIYRLVHQLASQGKAVVMISSYLPELLGTCTSLAVMFKGEMSDVRPVPQWDEHAILRFATSGSYA